MQVQTRTATLIVGAEVSKLIGLKRADRTAAIDHFRSLVEHTGEESLDTLIKSHDKAINQVKSLENEASDLFSEIHAIEQACLAAVKSIDTGKVAGIQALPDSVANSVQVLAKSSTLYQTQKNEAKAAFNAHAQELGEISSKLFTSIERSLNLLPVLAGKFDYAVSKRKNVLAESKAMTELYAEDSPNVALLKLKFESLFSDFPAQLIPEQSKLEIRSANLPDHHGLMIALQYAHEQYEKAADGKEKDFWHQESQALYSKASQFETAHNDKQHAALAEAKQQFDIAVKKFRDVTGLKGVINYE